MNYRVIRLSPLASTLGNERSTIQRPPSASPESSSGILFLRHWFEYETRLDEPVTPGHINWNAVFGIVLVAGISACFWAGVGWMVAALLN